MTPSIGCCRKAALQAAMWIVGALAILAHAADAQSAGPLLQPKKPLAHRPPTSVPSNLRVDIQMVLVPVTVTDASDRPVEDLKPESFRLFEDDVEQKIATFTREEGPVSVGLLFDSSGSMKGRMDRSVKGVGQFLSTSMEGDEFFLIRFSDHPEIITDFTPETRRIENSLAQVQPQGWTALNDAICLGLQRLKYAKNSRRALLVLSDGADNNSRYSDWEIRNLVRESDVRVYSIGLFERAKFLEKLAADSGGRAFYAASLEDLPDIVQRLSREFRSQYVLGYSSGNLKKDAKYRKIKVDLVQTIRSTALNVFWRRGYFAPSD